MSSCLRGFHQTNHQIIHEASESCSCGVSISPTRPPADALRLGEQQLIGHSVLYIDWVFTYACEIPCKRHHLVDGLRIANLMLQGALQPVCEQHLHIVIRGEQGKSKSLKCAD